MVTKIFAATYVNMAVVALVAYGYLHNKPGLAKQVITLLVNNPPVPSPNPQAQLFNGDFSDFTAAWYAQVGSYLVLTFAIQTISPLSIRLMKYYILSPLRYQTVPPLDLSTHDPPLESHESIQKCPVVHLITIPCRLM
jgi:hypothetical protein